MINLTINGTIYQYPEVGDESWGDDATNWAAAVTVGMLQKSGGLFQLLAELDFGSTYGIKSTYFKSRSGNPASAGSIRLARIDSIAWRNQANDGNLLLSVDSLNTLTFNGFPLAVGDAITELTGDVTAIGPGSVVATIANNAITTAKIIDAAITTAKIGSLQVVTGNIADLAITTAKIVDSAVTLAKMANIAGLTLLGNNSASPGAPIALTTTQAGVLIPAYVGASAGAGGTKGSVPPASAGQQNRFLRGDSTWVALPLTYSDTDTINLSFSGTTLTGDLRIAGAGPSPVIGKEPITLFTDSAGLWALIDNADIQTITASADTSTRGLLTAADWNTFNGKQAAGNYVTALTGDVTASGPGSVAATIANAAVSLAKMANLAANSIIGNNTGSAATPIALSGAQITAMLSNFVGDSGAGGTKGLVPAPGIGDATKFLKGDGSWGTGGGGSSYTFNDTNSINLTDTSTVITADLNLSAAAAAGGNTILLLDIQSDGLRGQIANSAIIAAIPNASTSVTGLLTSTNWNTFNGKQAAGNYLTALTGDVTASGPGSAAATIAAAAVSLSKMANVPALRIIGNNTGSSAQGIYLTAAQVSTMLPTFVGDSGAGGTKGLVTTPAIGDATKFLKGDGTWATPAGAGTITALTGDVTASGSGSVAATIANAAVTLAKMANLAANSFIGNNTGGATTPLALTVTQATAMLNAMTGDAGSGGLKGLVPAQIAGDATKFLRGDATWATVPAALTVNDTNSINLTYASPNLSADLNLSAAAAAGGNTILLLDIQSDGLRGQITNASIIAAIPNASTSVTGLLTDTDWDTFNNKQAAGNYVTALTGDVTASGPGSVAATIAAAAVSLAKMANLAANSFIGNNTGSAATPLALTATQATAMLNDFVGATGIANGTKGLVPAPLITNLNEFLCGDGSWSTIPLNSLAGLQETYIIVGDAADVATGVPMTGDITISNTGVTAVGANKITNAQLAQMAAHTFKGNNTGSTADPIDLTATQLTAELNAFSSSLKGLAPASGGGTTNFLRADGTWAAAGGGGSPTLQDIYNNSSTPQILVTDTTSDQVSIKDSATNTNRTSIFEVVKTGGTQVFGVTKDGLTGDFNYLHSMNFSSITSDFTATDGGCMVTKMSGYVIVEGTVVIQKTTGSKTVIAVVFDLPFAAASSGACISGLMSSRSTGTVPTASYFGATTTSVSIPNSATTVTFNLSYSGTPTTSQDRFHNYRLVYKI